MQHYTWRAPTIVRVQVIQHSLKKEFELKAQFSMVPLVIPPRPPIRAARWLWENVESCGGCDLFDSLCQPLAWLCSAVGAAGVFSCAFGDVAVSVCLWHCCGLLVCHWCCCGLLVCLWCYCSLLVCLWRCCGLLVAVCLCAFGPVVVCWCAFGAVAVVECLWCCCGLLVYL